MGCQHLCPCLPAAAWAVQQKVEEWSVDVAENDEGGTAQKARAHRRALLNGGLQHTSMLEGKPEGGRPLGPTCHVDT